MVQEPEHPRETPIHPGVSLLTWSCLNLGCANFSNFRKDQERLCIDQEEISRPKIKSTEQRKMSVKKDCYTEKLSWNSCRTRTPFYLRILSRSPSQASIPLALISKISGRCFQIWRRVPGPWKQKNANQITATSFLVHDDLGLNYPNELQST